MLDFVRPNLKRGMQNTNSTSNMKPVANLLHSHPMSGVRDQNGEPAIKWKILKQSTPRKPGDKECQLCLEEKLLILKNSRDPLCLNRRSELSNRCVIFHRTKHKLDAIE